MGVAINRKWREDRAAFEVSNRNALSELRALSKACRIELPDGTETTLPPALACLVGYFGYETIGLVETLPRAPASPLAMPDMLFVRPTIILIFDGLTDTLHCAAPIWPEARPECSPETAIERAGERIDETLLALAAPRPQDPRVDAARGRA